MKIYSTETPTTNDVTEATLIPLAPLTWEEKSLCGTRKLRWATLAFLFITALALRLYQITQPLLDFQPARQYRSALIARAYYYETAASVPDWKKSVASVNARREGILEPPIIETLASLAYRAAGGERLWIPRLLSTSFWLIGGAFLYLIAKKVGPTDAAVFSTAFYLFLPFGIAASRSFQPDPMMIMMLLASVLFILRYYDQPSLKRLLLAASTSSVAIFIKPVCLFVMVGAFGAMAIGRRKAVSSTVVFLGVSLLPALLFYSYGLFVGGFLQEQAQVSFVPQLLVELSFWKFWFKHIYRVIGFTALIGALLGTLLFCKGQPRRLVLGLWFGYLAFGLVFTYHIHTHDYYQLQLVPIVALCLGPLCALILSYLLQQDRSWHRQAVLWSTLLLALLLTIGLYLRAREELPSFETEVALAQEIGEAVAHSTEAIYLDSNYGQSLKYHGHFSGVYWPDTGEQRAAKLWGEPELSVVQRFEALSRNKAPEYFIVTNSRDFEAQRELNEFLGKNFVIVAENAQYVLFDLRARKQ